MSVTIQVRRDSAANWTSTNPTLHQGELGVETDTRKAKLGDGSTAWTSLAYWQPGGAFLPLAGGAMQGFLAPAVVTLTQSGGTVAVDADDGNDFRLTLTASGWTIANPSNPSDGQVINFVLTQDATGGRTVTWAAGYSFGSAGAPSLASAASAVTVVGFKYDAAAGAWVYIGTNIPPGGGSSAVQDPYLPGDDGYALVSWPPHMNGSTFTPPNGFVIFTRMTVRVAGPVSKLAVAVASPAGSSASTGTFAGLFLVNGTSLTQLTGSSDMGATLATGPTGNSKGVALTLTSTQNLAVGQVVCGALLINMSSPPTLYGLNQPRGASNAGINQGFPNIFDYPNGGSGTTTLPGTGVVTTSNIDVGSFSQGVWMGLL